MMVVGAGGLGIGLGFLIRLGLRAVDQYLGRQICSHAQSRCYSAFGQHQRALAIL